MQVAEEKGPSRIQAAMVPSCLGRAGDDMESVKYWQEHALFTFSALNLKFLSTCTSVFDFSPYHDGNIFVTIGRNKLKNNSKFSGTETYLRLFFCIYNLGLFRSSAFSLFLTQSTTSPQ